MDVIGHVPMSLSVEYVFDAGQRLITHSEEVHRELKELVDVEMTPFEALRTSTTRPFEYLGEIDSAGTELGVRP